jgi:hypothetical protein
MSGKKFQLSHRLLVIVDDFQLQSAYLSSTVYANTHLIWSSEFKKKKIKESLPAVYILKAMFNKKCCLKLQTEFNILTLGHDYVDFMKASSWVVMNYKLCS